MILHNSQFIYNALWIPKTHLVLCHTLFKSPEKWSMDQLCNCNTQNKAHRGLAVFIIIIPIGPIQMRWISGTRSSLPVFACAENRKEAIAKHLGSSRDGWRPPRSAFWRWLIRLWGQRSESQPMWQRWGEPGAWTSQRAAGRSIDHATDTWQGRVFNVGLIPL